MIMVWCLICFWPFSNRPTDVPLPSPAPPLMLLRGVQGYQAGGYGKTRLIKATPLRVLIKLHLGPRGSLHIGTCHFMLLYLVLNLFHLIRLTAF